MEGNEQFHPWESALETSSIRSTNEVAYVCCNNSIISPFALHERPRTPVGLLASILFFFFFCLFQCYVWLSNLKCLAV